MVLAGEIAVPLTKEYAVDTASSGTFTAETVVDSITVTLVSGQAYEIAYWGCVISTVANDVVNVTLREDSIGGTVLDGHDIPITVASSRVYRGILHYIYTAVASGSKTFVVTAQRRTGTGSITRFASANAPAQIVVKQW